MKEYQDKSKQDKLQEIINNKTRISYRVLQELERDEILEDYDLFSVISNLDDMYVFYLDGKFQLITKNRKDFKEVGADLLQTRCFVIESNRIKQYIQTEEYS